jgi:hypothetical protein
MGFFSAGQGEACLLARTLLRAVDPQGRPPETPAGCRRGFVGTVTVRDTCIVKGQPIVI